MSAGPRENLSPNPSLPIAGQTLHQLSYGELVGEPVHLLGSYVTGVLHTARISNV